MDRAVELFTRSPALRKGWTDERVAYAVRGQWRAAQNGLRHIVAFGAMLLEVERWLAAKKGKFKRAGEGGGLKAWLSEHCPEVNYKTAAGYKAAALGLRQAAKLAADRPLLPLMGEKPLSDEEEERARGKVMEVVATSSLRLLKEAARALPPPKTGGSTKAAAEANGNRVGRPPEPPANPARDALHVWTLAIDAIRKIPDGAYRLLPVEEARGMRDELRAAADRLDAHVIECSAEISKIHF